MAASQLLKKPPGIYRALVDEPQLVVLQEYFKSKLILDHLSRAL